MPFVLLVALLFFWWQQPPVSAIRFVDVAAVSGIKFQHDNAASAEKYLVETMGGGAAWLDYDGDGNLDLYLVNSAATKAYRPPAALSSALYRNLGGGKFQDVTAQAGVGAAGLFGMGPAAADFDNDGDTDLFVGGHGRSILFRNRGDGTFEDVTSRAGLANQGRWASSAAWLDYDRDGWLDLVVANYLDFTPENNLLCDYGGQRGYCHPNRYKGQAPSLFRNNRDGTFVDAGRAAGLAGKAGNGLGVVCFDADGDGWTDIFLANDSMANFLYINKRNGTFQETGVPAGVAFSEDGKTEAGMGVDAADYDGDGRLDLFVTHLDHEFNRLYRNTGGGAFEDVTSAAGFGRATWDLSGFGVRFVDYDNDGWRDLFIVNGHVLDNVAVYHPGTLYAERKTVFRNTNGKFREVTAELGGELTLPRVSRAAAFADYDNDGDLDVLVANNGQAPQLLRNDGGNGRHWLRVRLAGTKSNREGIGAMVRVTAGGRTQVEEKKGGMSYQASHDPRLHFGLGSAVKVDSIEVKWPGGAVTKLPDIGVDREVVVTEPKL